MSINAKQLPKCLKIAETSVVIIVFNSVLCEIRAYTGTVSYPSLYMNQVLEKLY